VGGFRRCQQQIKLLGPGDERMRCGLAFLLGLRAFDPVENLVPDVDSRAGLMLAQECDRICKGSDDPPIAQVAQAE
jgi:hypothetical protein